MIDTMKLLRIALPSVILCLGLITPAYAYLDPGTGSLLLQGLIASVAAAAATVSIYWHKVRAYFSKTKHTNSHVDQKDQEGEEDE